MKQETLEDARFKAYTDFFESNQDVEMYSFVGGFNKGSKWQQERSYSELVDLLERLTPIYREDSDSYEKYDKKRLEFIEQFKKK